MDPTPKLQACCSMPWPVVTGSALASMRPAWWRTPSARDAGWPTRQRHIGSGNVSTINLWIFRPCPRQSAPTATPSLARHSGSGDWSLGNVYIISRFPRKHRSFGCKEAATYDVITPRQGEHLVSGIWGCFGRPLRNRHAIPASRHSRNHYGFPRQRLDRHRGSSRPAVHRHDIAHATLHRGGSDVLPHRAAVTSAA